MENGLTKDEIASVNNAVESMKRVGLFCENCRNTTCICDAFGNAPDEEDPDYDDSHECCDDCGCYHGHHPWCDEYCE
jgi:hypothetical protein